MLWGRKEETQSKATAGQGINQQRECIHLINAHSWLPSAPVMRYSPLAHRASARTILERPAGGGVCEAPVTFR